MADLTKEEIEWFKKYQELETHVKLFETAKENETNRLNMLDSKISFKENALQMLDAEYEKKRKVLSDSIEHMHKSVESGIDFIDASEKRAEKARKELNDFTSTFSGNKTFDERFEEFKEWRKNLMQKQK